MQKELWLRNLAEFIVEANKETWAADKGEVEPFLPNHKMHRYKRDSWELIDDYSGYFRAPGITVVSYKEMPSWHMYYGGTGMIEGQYERVKDAFQFLREALMHVTPELPFRGPTRYKNGDWLYTFNMRGNIEDGTWVEKINNKKDLVFTQTGATGIYIHRTPERKPLYPWDL